MPSNVVDVPIPTISTSTKSAPTFCCKITALLAVMALLDAEYTKSGVVDIVVNCGLAIKKYPCAEIVPDITVTKF